MKANVVSINISDKKGVVKTPIDKGKFLKDYGLENDAHSGNWHRQVSLLALESYDKLDLPERLPIGSFAENITTQGIELHTLPIGTQIQIGELVLVVTQIGKKCHTSCEIKSLVGDCVMPREGIFAEVIQSGEISKNDKIEIKEGDGY